MTRLDRWLYKQGVLWECRLKRLDVAWVRLFLSEYRGSKYRAQLREAARLLSQQLGHEVLHTIERNGFVAYIRTEQFVIAQISCVTHGTAADQAPYLRIELDSRYNHFKALLQGAFVGSSIFFQHLPLLLEGEVSSPRGQ